MKKMILAFFVGWFLLALPLYAQQYDVLDQVRSDVRKSYGMEGPHRFDTPAPLTKAPKGYKPFYINHYGRHGSRYAWNADTYIIVHNAFAKAKELGVLTPYGQEFARKYEVFYMEPWINAGDLVPLGFDQHQRIGEFIFYTFPAVFKGERKVDALSSTSQRCIVSMGAFNLGLKSRNEDLRIRLNSNHKGMTIVAPPSAPRTLRKHYKGEQADLPLESADDFWDRKVDFDGILDKLFTDCSFFDGLEGGSRSFVVELFQIYCGYHNYVTEPLFDDLLTDEQRVNFWEAFNYSSFRTDQTARYSEIPLLVDFIEKAESAFLDSDKAADLRFGHDYILEAFVALLNLNGCATVPATADEVKYWFQSYNIPMAATLLFVYYKNRKDDILFKVLLNEEEVSLPALNPVNGPYYRWSDFLAWAKAVIEAHPQL